MTERKRTKAEERSYSALRDVLIDLELFELEQWNNYRKLKERVMPGAWRAVEREVPVRPKKIRVTAAYEEEVVEWFRAMGHNYQARTNSVLRAYMLAVKSREITSRKDIDWKGDEI